MPRSPSAQESRTSLARLLCASASFWRPGTSNQRHPSFSLRDAAMSLIAVCFILVLLCSESADAKAHPHAKPRVYVVKQRNSPMVIKKCRVYNNPALHMIMDKVCLLCSEMFSHERPNMRSECRANCFKSEHFRKCLNVFSPQNSGQILKQLD